MFVHSKIMKSMKKTDNVEVTIVRASSIKMSFCNLCGLEIVRDTAENKKKGYDMLESTKNL